MELLLNFAEEHFGLAFVTGVILVAAVLCGIVWLTIWIVKFTLSGTCQVFGEAF